MAESSVKVVSGLIDVDTLDDEDVLILRGVIDPGSLEALRIDDYQREQLSPAKIERIMDGIRSRGVPDIVLGMRGESYIERNGYMYLQDPVYIIDGYQRVTAAIKLMVTPGGVMPRLGAKLHFDTSYKFEKELFDKLNLEQTRLSGNVTLRNRRDTNPSIDALYRLTQDRAFRLHDKVCWGQNMRRGDLISAITYIKVAAMLHSHAGPGRSSSTIELANGLDKIMEVVGKKKMVENVRRYFQLIDSCWGIGQVYYRNTSTYLKMGFMVQLARVLSDHNDFWEADQLNVGLALQKKIAMFPVNDPEVTRLASSAGMAGTILYTMLVDFINSGKRTRRLTPRRPQRDRPVDYVDSAEEAE